MFKEWIEAHEFFELVAPVPVSLVCFRLNDGRSEEGLNELNKQFLERVNQTGTLLMTHTALKGKYVLRMAVASRLTKERHVREAWALLQSVAEEMLGK
jgi:glutamate/tyrosine decarboxylase-like PLP-dependent enzyme